MTDERTAIIIKEIKFWKQHKILPEVYCDYLLALYTKGDSTLEETSPDKKRSGWNLTLLVQLFLLVLLIPFSFLVIYFTEFSIVLQLTILFLFLAYTLWLFVHYKKNQKKLFNIVTMVLLILILVLSNFIGKLIFQSSSLLSGLIMIGNFVFWLVIGKKYHRKYLVFTGVLAIIITFIYIVYNFFIPNTLN